MILAAYSDLGHRLVSLCPNAIVPNKKLEKVMCALFQYANAN